MPEHDGMHREAANCPHLGQLHNPLECPQLDNPHPFYARARSEEPVFFSERLQAWVVTRYEDIRSVLLRPDLFSSKDALRPTVTWIPEVFQILRQSGALTLPGLSTTDGKEHLRFRTPLNRAFLPGRLKAMEGMIRTVVHRLIDAFSEEGHTDLIATFARPLPQEIILRMFGIPQTDLVRCISWSDDMQALLNEPLSPQRQIECAHSTNALCGYMDALVEKRRGNPGEDVVSCLLTTHYDEARPLNKAEMVGMLAGVLIAGHETTTGLIGTSVYLLLSQPERWQQVCSQPEIIPSAVEEALRFDAPVPTFYRTTLQETQVGGVTIPQGGLLCLVYASANRDEDHFADGEQFDPQRYPNRHLAFGLGAHFCVGAPLARIEGRIALEVLSQRLSHLHLQPGQHLSYTPNVKLRGLKRLAVAWSVT